MILGVVFIKLGWEKFDEFLSKVYIMYVWWWRITSNNCWQILLFKVGFPRIFIVLLTYDWFVWAHSMFDHHPPSHLWSVGLHVHDLLVSSAWAHQLAEGLDVTESQSSKEFPITEIKTMINKMISFVNHIITYIALVNVFKLFSNSPW